MNRPTDIRTAALQLLDERVEGVPPQDLVGRMAALFGRSRRWAKSAIGELVAQGDLGYREQHGHTIIESSFDRPVRFSPHVVVKPPDTAYRPGPGEVVVRLAHGASFGTGRHPTTRLSVRGIDAAMTELGLLGNMAGAAALDVGTGSGILLIAAMSLGIERGVGIDIDPCAVDEARRNGALNGLSTRLDISRRGIGEIRGDFALITANLRYPTLNQIFPEMLRLSGPRTTWVVSGIRPGEIPPLRECYAEAGRVCLWRDVEKDWAALVFARPEAMSGARDAITLSDGR